MPKSGGYPLLVNPLTLAQLFERNVRYLVPLYQRPYVWNEDEQWLPLWKDIERLADRLISQKDVNRIHFLGASVQDKVDVLPGQVETRRLIDGQQRFTTLQLLLCAFRDIAHAPAALQRDLRVSAYPLLLRQGRRHAQCQRRPRLVGHRRACPDGAPAELLFGLCAQILIAGLRRSPEVGQ